MKLFPENPNENQLPYQGEVYYYGAVLKVADANDYFQSFMNTIAWRNDEAVIFGKKIITARKVAWYGDKAFPYRYSGRTKLALPWTNDLLRLRQSIEEISGESFNSCLLNLYHSGSEGMAWHSYGEKELVKNGAIASVSLGADRLFSFKHKKEKEVKSFLLEHGSLLIMKGETQTHWLHRLPPTKKVHLPRINLTFRKIAQ